MKISNTHLPQTPIRFGNSDTPTTEPSATEPAAAGQPEKRRYIILLKPEFFINQAKRAAEALKPQLEKAGITQDVKAAGANLHVIVDSESEIEPLKENLAKSGIADLVQQADGTLEYHIQGDGALKVLPKTQVSIRFVLKDSLDQIA